MLRYLRITAAVTSLIASMLLIALWVRSYAWDDTAHSDVFGSYYLLVKSHCGRLRMIVDDPQEIVFQSTSLRVSDPRSKQGELSGPMNWQFDVMTYANPSTTRIITFPYWFPAVISALLAASSGIRRPFQFSLRTLLIAMTIIAVWLGLIVWMI